MIKLIVAVDMGHTLKGLGSGAVGFVSESIWTRLIGRELINILEARGHRVVNVTVDSTSDYMDSLYRRKNAVPVGCDICISIHLNAAGGFGDGAEILTYKGVKHPEAVRILNNLEALGFKDFKDDGTPFSRGIKDGSSLVMCTTRAKKDILVEVCFVDSRRDADLLKVVSARDIAMAIANGIENKGVDDMGVSIEDVVNIVRDEIKRMILGESQIRALIESEVDRRVTPSRHDTAGNSETHWANDHFEYLNANGVEVKERRFDDLATRGELDKVVASVVKKTSKA